MDITDASFILKGDGLASTLLLSENIDAGSWSTLQPLPQEPPSPWPSEAVNCILFWPAVTDARRINGPRAGATADDLARPSSNHPGGVNVLLCDGSVKFIKDTINQRSWWALGTKAGGEVVSADSY